MSENQPLADAKRAMAAGDFLLALARLQEIDLVRLEAMPAVRVLLRMAACARALGLRDSNAEHHRAALQRLNESGALAPQRLTPDNARLALSLAVGARDSATAAELLQILFGPLPPVAAGFKISPEADATAWCGRHNIALVPMDAPQKYAADDGAGETVRYRAEATWHATIPGAEIVAGWDFPIAPTGEILVGTNYTPPDKAYPFMPHAYCETAAAFGHVWPAAVTRVDSDALFLGTPERHHFGHWLAEFLPRLRAWDKADGRKLAISASLPKKGRDLLARFGVRADDLIECELGKRYAFRSLRIVRTGRPDAPNPEDVRFLYAAIGPGSGPLGTKIYHLAREAGTRAPANEDEVKALFSEFGVIEVSLAKLSVSEQMELLKDARAVIGVHGTDLFALYKMRPGATVIELHLEEFYYRTVFGPACGILGLRHRMIPCARTGDRGAAVYKKDNDIIVDCGKLRAALAAL